MSHKHYVFTTPASASFYNDVKLEEIKIFQICAFPDPKTGKFEIREVIIDGDNNIKTYRTLKVEKKVQRKLLRALRDNKYRLFPVYTLAHIELPSCNDISLARSAMINNDNEYSGFASFESSGDFDWRGIIP